jgi:lysophospholipase L1-like esterase
MRPTRWLFTVFGTFAVLVATGIAVNMLVDIYGLFRDTRNRRLVDYGDDRIAKYLLSEHYVPQNFDAILVGPSVSANWDLHGIRTIRVYNESMNGSNFVEQECLVRNAVSTPGIKAALLVLHPSMTAEHDFSTVVLSPRENLSALGSVSLFEAYKDWFARKRNPGRGIKDDYGSDFFEDPVHLNAIAAKLMRPGSDFLIDTVSHIALLTLLGTLRTHHVQVVFIYPPAFQALFEPKRIAFSKYKQVIEAHRRPGEPTIDFTGSEFEKFWRDRGNFSDGVHISRAGSAKMVAMLDAELAGLRARGLL